MRLSANISSCKQRLQLSTASESPKGYNQLHGWTVCTLKRWTFTKVQTVMCKSNEMVGKQFHRLTVIKFAFRKKHNQPYFFCLCQCGNVKAISSYSLRRGLTRSCGCLHREELARRNTIHGQSKRKHRSSEYVCWKGMKERCYNPNREDFVYYGARNITVDPKWLNDFEQFYNDMGPKPGPKYSIERIDNDGPYTRSNCVWGTPKQQANNNRHNHKLFFNGRSKTIAQLAEATGLGAANISNRLGMGWSEEKTLTTPIKQINHERILEYKSQRRNVSEWARIVGISRSLISKRIEAGWSVEAALTTPIKIKNWMVPFNGQTKPLKEWAKELNAKYDTLHARLSRGWSVEKSFSKFP